MPLYHSTISTLDGKVLTKTISAPNRETAQKMLEKDGSMIVFLKELLKQKKWWQWSSPLSKRDILLITKRIGNMIKHGFSAADALRSIELQAQYPTLKDVAQNLRHHVEMGNTLSDALSLYPKYFSSVYVSLVKVGEQSGTLPKSFEYLDKQERQLYQMKKKAFGALIYPAVILTLMVVIGIGMVLFLIPFLRDIFSGFTAQLPLPTRILMASDQFLRNYFWFLIIALTISIVSLKGLFSYSSVRRFWQAMVMRLPIIGSLVKSYVSAQIIRTFATLTKTAVPLLQALDILVTVPRNMLYGSALLQIRDEVRKGALFSSALEKHPSLFSPLVFETVKLGEQGGNLADSLQYLAEIYEEEVKETLQTLTKFIQPFLLVMVGMMVAGFALAVIVPLQRLPSLIQQS